jgi:serine/threonine-protein kinase RsbT
MDTPERNRLSDEVHVRITADDDLIPARAEARAMATRLGFTRTDATLIATAVSEIARNIVVHVGSGEIVMKSLADGVRCGIEVVAMDKGPGIRDLASVLAHGYASRGGLGLGLPGARRLMDEFTIESDVDRGTRVNMKKWRVRDELERLRDRRLEAS